MKFLKKIVQNASPNFSKGGKYEKFGPFFGTIATFLFVPGHTTEKKGCHIRDGMDIKRLMFTVVIALLPCLFFGIWNVGYQHHLATNQLATGFEQFWYGVECVLPIIMVSYIAGLAVEFVFAFIKGHDLYEGFLVSGLLIPLVMPPDIPLWMVAVSTIFAVLIGKEIFGGTGMNIFNVALTARAFLFFAYPGDISGDKVWVSIGEVAPIDAYSGATILGQAALESESNSEFVMTHGEKYVDILHSAFMGYIPGSVGETSTLMCLIGAAILIFTKVASFRIIAGCFIGGMVMGGIFNLFAVNTYMELSPLLQICLGGFAFGAVFMATDPVTATQTKCGKWIYGFLVGFFGILIRVFNPAYPEGMMLSILFMNTMGPIIDHYVVQGNIRRRQKRINLKVKVA